MLAKLYITEKCAAELLAFLHAADDTMLYPDREKEKI
jgi:hypothetical protein